jgi:hypothetical protein
MSIDTAAKNARRKNSRLAFQAPCAGCYPMLPCKHSYIDTYPLEIVQLHQYTKYQTEGFTTPHQQPWDDRPIDGSRSRSGEAPL